MSETRSAATGPGVGDDTARHDSGGGDAVRGDRGVDGADGGSGPDGASGAEGAGGADADLPPLESSVDLAAMGRRAWQALGVLLLLGVVGLVASRLALAVASAILAVMIATTVAPLVTGLERRGLPRNAAAFVVTVGWAIGLIGLMVLLGWQLVDQVPEITSQLGDALERLEQEFPAIATDGDLMQRLSSGLSDGEALQQGLRGLSTSTKVLSGLALATVLSFFFVRDGERMWRAFVGLWTATTGRTVDRMGRAAHETVRQYVHGLTIVALADAVLSGIGLLLLGVPLATALAVMTFLAAYVPSVGAIVVGVMAVGLAFTSGGLVLALATAALYTAVQQVDSSVLQPWIMGHRLPLHPAAVLLALTAGALVAGVLGALLAVPFAAAVVAAVQAYRADAPTGALVLPDPDA